MAEQGTPSSGRVFTMLENNPNVMNALARRLGVSDTLSFYDIWSLDDDTLLALVPRPAYALLITVPMTDGWKATRAAEDANQDWYRGAGPNEPVLWFQQTISHGCGLIGFLHCVANGIPADRLVPGSVLADFVAAALPLGMADRAQLLKDSDVLYAASEAVATTGDSRPLLEDGPSGNHFIALVTGRDGNLWELEGSRKGPLQRGQLGADEDALSAGALRQGLRRLMGQSDGDAPFSCIVLAERADKEAN